MVLEGILAYLVITILTAIFVGRSLYWDNNQGRWDKDDEWTTFFFAIFWPISILVFYIRRFSMIEPRRIRKAKKLEQKKRKFEELERALMGK